jgi:hypothetical protein
MASCRNEVKPNSTSEIEEAEKIIRYRDEEIKARVTWIWKRYGHLSKKKGMAFGFEFRLMFHRASEEEKRILASSRQVKEQICTLSRW